VKHALARLQILLALLLLAALGAAFGGTASPVAQGQPADTQVARIAAPTPAQRWRLAGLGLDLLEYVDGDDLFALVSPRQLERLRADGWDVRVDAAQTALLPPGGPSRRAAPGGYRTVGQTEEFLRGVAAAHPGVATLVDYGDSWQKAQPGGEPGYDLLALRITHPPTATATLAQTAPDGLRQSATYSQSSPKPVFALVAAVHARELATSELATRFINYLLAGDGVDPEVTWLLDDYEVIVIPIANPDGRALADQGWLQRKNTNPGSEACAQPPQSEDQVGVDLNRNASFEWNSGGSSDQPCYATFHGVGPASEPEEQALEALLRGLFADKRGPNPGDAAPDDTPGVLISLHSYSDLVLWPWGNRETPAPNADGLQRLGRRMAALNGYTPQQSIELYSTSGTTDDWLYGERGVASFTFEVGPSGGACAGFFPAYSCLDEGARFWPRNLPALLYALRVARAPYTQPAGPDVRDIFVQSDGSTITVTATLDNGANEGAISAAELYLDRSPWAGGAAVALLAADGALDAATERVYAALPASAVAGNGLLLMRGNVDGIWGPLGAAWLAPKTQPRMWLTLVGNE
jgi:hypothetical protein